MRLRIEEPSEGAVWGNLIDIEVKDDNHELRILEVAKKHMKKKPRIERDGEEVKALDEVIDEVKERIEEKKKKGGGKRAPV